MEKGLNDKILDNMMNLHNKSISRIQLNLKGVKPFAQAKIPKEDLIYAKKHLGFLDMMELMQEYDPQVINKLMYDISLMEKRNGNQKEIHTPMGEGANFPPTQETQETQ